MIRPNFWLNNTDTDLNRFYTRQKLVYNVQSLPIILKLQLKYHTSILITDANCTNLQFKRLVPLKFKSVEVGTYIRFNYIQISISANCKSKKLNSILVHFSRILAELAVKKSHFLQSVKLFHFVSVRLQFQFLNLSLSSILFLLSLLL